MFENFWVSLPDFIPTVQFFWNLQQGRIDLALNISAKFKTLRRGLKARSKEISKLNKLINNSSYVLALLDGLEEQRPLSLMERNFRKQLQAHLLKLLESKRVYWKQRSTIRWVKFGDENTKLFHSIATHKFKRNYITSLQLTDGSLVTDHDQKAALLWTSFRDRLGQCEDTTMFFALDSLIQPELDHHFSTEEIECLIKELPTDKAPSPDGFNGMFIKKCWPIIKEDFVAFIKDFYNGSSNLKCLNNSFITLVLKRSFLPMSMIIGQSPYWEGQSRF
jgi:hypothetical protein